MSALERELERVLPDQANIGERQLGLGQVLHAVQPPRHANFAPAGRGWKGIHQFIDELERRISSLTIVGSRGYDGEDLAVVEWGRRPLWSRASAG